MLHSLTSLVPSAEKWNLVPLPSSITTNMTGLDSHNSASSSHKRNSLRGTTSSSGSLFTNCSWSENIARPSFMMTTYFFSHWQLSINNCEWPGKNATNYKLLPVAHLTIKWPCLAISLSGEKRVLCSSKMLRWWAAFANSTAIQQPLNEMGIDFIPNLFSTLFSDYKNTHLTIIYQLSSFPYLIIIIGVSIRTLFFAFCFFHFYFLVCLGNEWIHLVIKINEFLCVL